MSWSNYISDVLSKVNTSEKNVVHNCTKTLYKLFEKGYTVDEVIVFIRGSRV